MSYKKRKEGVPDNQVHHSTFRAIEWGHVALTVAKNRAMIGWKFGYKWLKKWPHSCILNRPSFTYQKGFLIRIRKTMTWTWLKLRNVEKK